MECERKIIMLMIYYLDGGKYEKILSVVFCSLLAFSMNSFTGAKAEENDMLYYKTIKSEVADTYAKETVYDFLIAENTKLSQS